MRFSSLLACLALPACLVLQACAVSPTGRSQFVMLSDGQLGQMGEASFAEYKRDKEVERSGQVNAYVRCVADAITAETGGRWEVVVFEDDTANAFALPGGKIGVHTGLLKVAETPDQLAAVIGHEVGHVLASHSNERMSQQLAAQAGMTVADLLLESQGVGSKGTIMQALGLGAQYGLLLPYSRTHESEADVIGQDLMARAGFDPRASVALWQNMKAQGGAAPPEIMSTHPAPDTRIRDLQAGVPAAMSIYEQARAAGRRPNC